MAAKGALKIAGLSRALSDAYFKVHTVSVTKNKGALCSAHVQAFENKEAAEQGSSEAVPALCDLHFTFPFVDGLTAHEMAYLKLPHVDGMSALVPVLEEKQELKQTPAAFLPIEEGDV